MANKSEIAGCLTGFFTVVRLLFGVPVMMSLWIYILWRLEADTWVWVLIFIWMPVALFMGICEEAIKAMKKEAQ